MSPGAEQSLKSALLMRLEFVGQGTGEETMEGETTEAVQAGPGDSGEESPEQDSGGGREQLPRPEPARGRG